MIRYALPASPAFPVEQKQKQGGGFTSTTGMHTNSWLTNDALSGLFREYKARSGSDLRVSEAARALIRRAVEATVNAVLAEIARGGRTRATADAIARAACNMDGLVLSF